MKPGHCSRDTKLTIILAAVEAGDSALPPDVRGSVNNPQRWMGILVKLGTTTWDFNDFLTFVCEDLQNNNPVGMVGNASKVFL